MGIGIGEQAKKIGVGAVSALHRYKVSFIESLAVRKRERCIVLLCVFIVRYKTSNKKQIGKVCLWERSSKSVHCGDSYGPSSIYRLQEHNKETVGESKGTSPPRQLEREQKGQSKRRYEARNSSPNGGVVLCFPITLIDFLFISLVSFCPNRRSQECLERSRVRQDAIATRGTTRRV